ncbi:aminotransferase class I/II-fold pyridoxal phosphate-dependent enzyme [Streptomyces stelliscabiei]|uniref:aminotransferase class I/II-fold pyridoxal phosphate-dependent enzyme n=1 Tax=Streptomyces stelliscabiei TaxID=146820 RepID=UPI0029A7E7D9|nr:aminotransferase class I/II-fold pyridoxal phosphate-dependent enzyme [Streptomyces stelliscabiei]MDX2554226.1 aminotransferase class I/II-fold pyridoxal phosphate-dependent enzyme [Streptomyces stelliscabiei]MDX2609903.1 aminotransferase class I/II-fold pyridoxal phosphate-dependent enzyme [Streptomyces stelliscabiei]MDX2638740.1 aminotransferase class I/II-fold pyridoxal phosphate-dependent enzyme [Streptomyces stelliscabiei]MDX2661893.1 aminotransferase class I/II-fold pyridoxal phosphate
MTDNPILAVAAQAEALRAQGADVITLAAGEPQAASSAAVVEAAVAAVRDPATHHYGTAQGDPALRALVATTVAGDTGLPWNVDDVQIALGAKHALFLATQALIDAGDEVLVAAPGWPGHAEVVAAAGGVAVPVATDEAFRLSAEALDSCRGPHTRALILSSPGNPTGAVHPEARLREIADWAQQHGIWVISDDIYRAFDYTGTYQSILRVAPRLRGRTVVVGGVSKEHAMTGWRVGWLAAPPEVIASARRHVSRTITHVPTINQRAALAALGDTGTPVEATRDYRRRRALLVEALNGIDGIDCPLPDGGMFAFPDVSGLLRDRGWTSSADLAAWLLDAVHLAVVPGEAFNAPGRIRVCFALDDDTLITAIERLRTACGSTEHETAAQQLEEVR